MVAVVSNFAEEKGALAAAANEKQRVSKIALLIPATSQHREWAVNQIIPQPNVFFLVRLNSRSCFN